MPRAKLNMMIAPFIAEPLESAATCIAWVKPQGRKNVPKPRRRGVRLWFSILRKNWKMFELIVSLFCLMTPMRLRPRAIMMIEAMRPRMVVKVKLTPMAWPMAPSAAPRMAKPTRRPE